MRKTIQTILCLVFVSATLFSCRESTTEKETVRTETVVKEEPVQVEEDKPSKVNIKLNDKGNVEGEVNID